MKDTRNSETLATQNKKIIVKISAGKTVKTFNGSKNNVAIYGNYHFYINQNIEKADYWIVYNNLKSTVKKEKTYCPQKHIILVSGEPPNILKFDDKYLAQFAAIVSCDTTLNHPNIIPKTILDYYLENYSPEKLKTLQPPKKEKTLSIIASNKTMIPGHYKRSEFANFIKAYFGNEVDLFGWGINPFEYKWDTLAKYKYHIAIENSQLDHYWTEKIMDPLLTYTYPFYFGTKNIHTYINPNCFSYIDIYDLKSSIKTIEKVIANNIYEKSLAHIQQEREKILTKYNVFQQFIDVIEQLPKDSIYKRNTLRPIKKATPLSRLLDKTLRK